MNDITQNQTQDIDWKQKIRIWKLSGLSQAQFCNNNNLIYHRFVYWRESLTMPPGLLLQSRAGLSFQQ